MTDGGAGSAERPSVGGLAPADLVAALRTDPVAAARQCTRAVGRGVFALPSVPTEWCAAFLAAYDRRIAAQTRAGDRPDPPNNMHLGGAALDALGWSGLFDDALREWLRPLAAELFPECGGATLDFVYAFVAEYGPGADDDLGFHADNAEVTLNLCLGEEFAGSDLVFRGRRCARHRQDDWRVDEVIEYEHQPGVAILHAGAHRHEVDFLLGGRRRNLILWLQSGAYRAEQERLGDPCPGWCDALQ